MPQRFYEDDYEDAESFYSVGEDDYQEDCYDEEDYEESPASPYESPPRKNYYDEEPRIVPRGPTVDSWQSIFHSLRGASDPLPNTVSWTDMRSYLDTIRPEPFPPRAPTPEPRVLPETSPRIDRMIQELAAKEEEHKVLKGNLKELKTAFTEATEKQVEMAERFAEQEKKKPYKWGPQSKVVSPLETQLKKLDAEILVLRNNLAKADEKDRALNKELIHDRKYLEEEKEMWEVYKRYTAFEHTLVGPVLQS